MVAAIVSIETEAYRKRKYRRTIAGEAPFISVLRWLADCGNRREESLCCQLRCHAPPRELMDSIKELVSFHRPCLQYPLSEHWWRLNQCDYAAGKLSALLDYPEKVGNLVPAKLTTEIVWAFTKTTAGEIEVRLDWYNLTCWNTRYKHNVLLSMVAYTEERLRRLNSAYELQASVRPSQPLLEQAYVPQSRIALRLPDRESSPSFWPSPQDYNEAVQNPASAFLDEELAGAAAEEDSLGMPRAASGAFASVYHLRAAKRDLAVRCFLFPVKDQQQRYSILSRHFSAHPFDSLIDFTFIEQGIKVQGRSLPILKMEWIEGLPLHVYVENNLREAGKLTRLRNSFRKLICNLRQAKTAHGDLQHGNILVRSDQLFLVDYDGMFVPELARFSSPELGHPNYQHPKRDGKHFGLYLDTFAGWLIDISLLCLAEDPFLWDRFSGGDECLLIRREDLLNPEKSELFNFLSAHPSAKINSATEHFLSLLQLELEAVPFLEENPE